MVINWFLWQRKWAKLLDIGEASPVLEQFLKATTKFKRELPIDTEMESVSVIQFPSLAGDMHIKTQQTW